jgi:hypothetical protein
MTAAAMLLLAGCAATPAADVGSSPWAEQSGRSGQHAPVPPPAWQHRTFPGKAASQFRYARHEGRDTISAHAVASASMLRQDLRIEPADLAHVRFSWKVPGLIPLADMALREKDDAPVRIVLAFEGDRSRFSQRDAALSELARALTGEEMPYATLMYVWCNKREPGSVIVNPRTDRIRKLVVESGPRRLNQWLDYERDIRADFERAFGEKPGALIGIGIMTDSDNTRSSTQAWYGPLRFLPVAAKP